MPHSPPEDAGDLSSFPLLLPEHPELRTRSARKPFRKGEFVLREGDRSRKVFCLEEGLVKLSLSDARGGEWIKSFIAAPGLFAARETLASGSGAPFSAICLEACVVRVFAYDDVERACAADPRLSRARFRFEQAVAIKKERRERRMLTELPEDAYRGFMAEHRALAARLTQGDIARYLGLTPVGLSRIRKRVAATNAGARTR